MQTLLILTAANIVSRACAIALACLLAYRMLVRFAHFTSGAACGMLLAISCTHLIPESLEHGLSVQAVCLTLLLSFLAFIAGDKLLSSYAGHVHGLPRLKRKAALVGGGYAYEKMHSHGARGLFAIVVGTSVHNAIDGLVIAAAFMDSVFSGLIVTAAIFAHEVPQLTGIFVLLEQTGASRRQAVTGMTFAAFWAVAGSAAAFLFLNATAPATGYALAVAAASFLYVVFAVFVPDILHKSAKSLPGDFAALLFGVLFSLAILAPLHGLIE